MKEKPRIRRIAFVFYLVISGYFWGGAQSELLQLSLLLEEDQHFEWTEVFPVWLAQDIPARISLGKIKNENILLGLINVNGLDEQLILHGMVSDHSLVMYEWYDDVFETGKVVLEKEGDNIRGHWFNITGERRYVIEPRVDLSPSLSTVFQYQAGENSFFMVVEDSVEQIQYPSFLDERSWAERKNAGKGCYHIDTGGGWDRFCPVGEVQLYDYYKVDLVHLIHGKVPQIPHDEIFNSYISDQLRHWEVLLLKDSIVDIEYQRWSENQNVWFIPDLITAEVISGLLSIQSSGEEIMHSLPIIYDKKQNKFYTTEDFFRNNAPWNKDFQEMARVVLYEKYRDVIDVFPEVFEQLQFHLTITTQGLLISSDFTPYFGRLIYQLDDEGHRDQIQKFAPLRKIFHSK